MRLVDADKLADIIEDWRKEFPIDKSKNAQAYYALSDLLCIVCDQPTIELTEKQTYCIYDRDTDECIDDEDIIGCNCPKCPRIINVKS